MLVCLCKCEWILKTNSDFVTHLSAGVTYLVPIGLSIRPLKRWLSLMQRTKPFLTSFRPVQPFSGHSDPDPTWPTDRATSHLLQPVNPHPHWLEPHNFIIQNPCLSLHSSWSSTALTHLAEPRASPLWTFLKISPSSCGVCLCPCWTGFARIYPVFYVPCLKFTLLLFLGTTLLRACVS